MTDRRRRTAASDSTSREDNPFAPPPEGQPDQPWQPRQPRRLAQDKDDGSGPGDPRGPRDSGTDSGNGSGRGGDGSGGNSGSSDDERRPDEQRDSAWGSQWSSRQPGRHGGSFGGDRGSDRDRDRQGDGDRGAGGPGGGPGGSGGRGMRWDPTDPLQRHARYALHAGIWGLFFALLGVPEVALLLGALSLYWGISALRGKPPKSTAEDRRSKGGKPRRSVTATAEDVAGTDRGAEGEEEPGRSAGPGGPGGAGGPDGRSPVPLAVTPAQAAKAKRTAAISGLVTAGLTLAIVAATYTFQFAYSDYYTCQNDALTQSSRDDCERHLPKELQPFLENR
ncbi:hypothetical protein [Streptomyces reniochalinae]|uniref:Integral membrane protein n=1 Tax=Streptomyces reniochalinae TaxID=2250578 RepID=A0A367EMS5_9ACTN|nr:hypothetical protein [Streptomyces reniochalinae]RCG19273.1 hypothetical protein DQ392_11405 [Streptomyces reniochalinae]